MREQHRRLQDLQRRDHRAESRDAERRPINTVIGHYPKTKELVARIEEVVGLDHFRRIRQLVLENGRFYIAQPLPPGFPVAEPGRCHQVSMDVSLDSNLHYVEGFTYKEIAGALQVSEARVCQLHGEAVKKLKVVLAEAE